MSVKLARSAIFLGCMQKTEPLEETKRAQAGAGDSAAFLRDSVLSGKYEVLVFSPSSIYW